MILTSNGRLLLVAGALLFLIGLLQGAAVSLFVNPRMALSAHLTAVQSGMALMILGVVWSFARWSLRVETLSLWLTLLGTYGLWLALTLSAATGASEALPMAGRGYEAAQSTERVVSALVVASSISMTIGWFAFVVGLVRPKVGER